MSFETKDILMLLGIAVGGIVAWVRMQAKSERLEEKHNDHLREKHGSHDKDIAQLFDFWNAHEKESGLIRERFNREIGELRSSILVNNEQFKRILEMLQEIKDRLTDLEQGDS